MGEAAGELVVGAAQCRLRVHARMAREVDQGAVSTIRSHVDIILDSAMQSMS